MPVMENLGFTDKPGEPPTWTTNRPTTPPPPAPSTVQSASAVAVAKDDPFEDWTPTEVGARLIGGNLRWSLVLGIALITAGVIGLGYWVMQRPASELESASQSLSADARGLEVALASLAEATREPDGDISSELRSVDTAARDLFATSAELPSNLETERSLATTASSDSLEAVRIINDSLAYRSAVIPILAAPELETDPDLVGLDDAVFTYGEWQNSYTTVVLALPSGTLSTTGEELRLIASELEAIGQRYIDALRTDDQLAAEQAATDLDELLISAEANLGLAVEMSMEQARRLLSTAAEATEALLG